MQYRTLPSYSPSPAPSPSYILPTESNIIYHQTNPNSISATQPSNIFKNQKNSSSHFNPNDKPVGGLSTIKRIRDSFFPLSTSTGLKKTTLSTKTDTLIPQSNIKTKTQFNASITATDKPKEEILKRDIRGLSVDRIKMVNKRILSKKSSSTNKPTIYERTSKPFLEKMNKRSMSQYSQQLTKKYGNSYFEKTLRNSYQDDPAKIFVVTLFDKEKIEVKSGLRKKAINMPFFKRHQFMEVKGEDKKEKEVRGSRTQLY